MIVIQHEFWDLFDGHIKEATRVFLQVLIGYYECGSPKPLKSHPGDVRAEIQHWLASPISQEANSSPRLSDQNREFSNSERIDARALGGQSWSITFRIYRIFFNSFLFVFLVYLFYFILVLRLQFRSFVFIFFFLKVRISMHSCIHRMPGKYVGRKERGTNLKGLFAWIFCEKFRSVTLLHGMKIWTNPNRIGPIGLGLGPSKSNLSPETALIELLFSYFFNIFGQSGLFYTGSEPEPLLSIIALLSIVWILFF